MYRDDEVPTGERSFVDEFYLLKQQMGPVDRARIVAANIVIMAGYKLLPRPVRRLNGKMTIVSEDDGEY